MQKGKNMQYAMAGVQLAPGIRMNVKSHVRVPDAEAGYESDRTPYYAAETRPATARRAATISCTAGVVFLFVVFAAVGLLVVGRAARRAELSKSISAMESSISQTLKENSQLTVEVMEARDSARICYAAAQNLGMVASTGVEAVLVTAPETRPAHESSPAEGSPLHAVQGIISGSR